MHLCRGGSQSSDYYVDVSPPPSQVTSSSTITITCYQDQNLRVAIPSDVVWTRVHHGWSKKLPDQGHAYVCTPNDIGCRIQVQVTGKHPQYRDRNSIVIHFAPVVLDPLLRPTIQHILKNSVASFAVSVICSNKTKQYVLHISDIDIQIKDPRTGSNIKSTYSAIQPQLIQNTVDPSIVTLIVPKQNQEDYSKFFGCTFHSQKSMSIKIRFDDRNLRDSFVLARKAFVVKRQVRLLNIIQNSLDSTISNPNAVDLLIQMSSVKAYNQFLLKKKQMYRNQVQVLQAQIVNLKNTYQGIMAQSIEKRPQKHKFDQMLSLLDSSDHSKRFGYGFSGSEFFQNYETFQKLKLAVIGQQNQFQSQIKVNSENVIYSQVIPFNQQKYSKKFSYQQKHIRNEIIQKSAKSQQSSVNHQSILDSSNQVNSSYEPFRSHNIAIQKSNKLQLFNAWQEQAHKNMLLQSKILELERVIATCKSINVDTPEGQQIIIKQNRSLIKSIKQRNGLINLLNAENTNLKLQIDNSNSIKQAYKVRCNSLQKLSINQSQFELKLKPYFIESQKLLKQSKHLNSLLKSEIKQQIDNKDT